jgi:transglutaminase-like putative cysteine protease
MRKYHVLLMGLLLCTSVVRADERQAKPTQELWDAAYLGPSKIGYLHTTIQPIERDGKKLLRTTQELMLTLKRDGQVGQVRMESGTEEDADGKVVTVFMTQFFGGKNKLVEKGTVEDGGLHITNNTGVDKLVPWNDEAIGLSRQERLFQQRKAKPGDQITFHSYEPTISSSVTVHATVKDEEEVEVLRVSKEGKVQRVKERLLRVEAKPDEVKIGDQPLKLPAVDIWLGKDLLPRRSSIEMQPFGKIVFYRTTRAVATAANGALSEPALDILRASMIRLNRPIPDPHETSSILYRIRIKDDDKPETALAQDDRQKVEKVQGRAFDLRVRAVRAPQGDAGEAEVKDEFRRPCYFIDSDNQRVQELAQKSVGKETDPWKKAQAIERWVHLHMQSDNRPDFPIASQIADELRGDCRQHALLTAALCRAAGVPSRTAVGLVYVNRARHGPEMGFHMWTEVWVKGQWLAIDATLGRGSIGAAHIKISDHSWNETRSLTPLLPVHRVLGKMSIEVVSVD